MTRRLRNSRRNDTVNSYPLTPGAGFLSDPADQWGMDELSVTAGRADQNDYDLTYLNPPLTPSLPPSSLQDTVDDTDDLSYIDNTPDPGPLSVADSLDTPHNTPENSPPRPSFYTGRGPKLSEDESDEEPTPPAPKQQETGAQRKRRVSPSPEDPSKRSHIDSAARTDITSRASRPRQRESAGPQLSSSSSPEVDQPPATPRPVKSENKGTPGKGYSVDELLKKEKMSPDRRVNRRRAPNTSSSSSSPDRPSTPVPRKLRRASKSPVRRRPKPVVRRKRSPLPSTSKWKSEPRTPRPEERSPSNALTLYDAAEALKRRMGTGGRSSPVQRRQSPPRSDASYSYGTPGTVKSIKMYNIMCHQRFEKAWSPKFNFIIGDNGSGKSAILSGIVAGLGGRAFDTGRANSMKAIIKNGQANAKIEIVLNNHPSKMYGDEIRIVRYLSAEGSSSRYQIADANKQLRKLSRDELSLVLSKLNIQVDNPLAILHQEMSRNFLRTSDPNLLYNYFYRALLLNSCESLLKKSSDDLQLALKVLTGKKLLRDDLRGKELELKKDVELIQSLRDGKQKLATLENEYLWALAKESEEAFYKAQKTLEDTSETCEAARTELDAVSAQSQEYDRSLSSHDERWQEISTKLASLNAEYDAKRREAHDINVGVSEISGKTEMNQRYIKQHHVRLQRLENKVYQYEANMAREFQKKQQEVEAKKISIQHEREQLMRQLKQIEYEQSEMMAKAEIAEKTEQEQEQNIMEIKRKLDGLQQELKEYQKTKSSKYDAYGREISRIVDKINCEKRWDQKPRGPLGSCILVKEEKWAPLVEYILGSSLCSFAVSSKDDYKLLDKIIEDVYKSSRSKNPNKPSVCLMTFGDTYLNIEKGKAVCQYPTVLDAIEIVDNDYVVFNWIIDACNIERILLFDNYEDACSIMKNQSNAPRTTLRGFSLDEYMFTPDPNYKALAQNKLKPPRFLKLSHQQLNTVSNTEFLDQEIRSLRVEYQTQSALHQKLQEEAVKARKVVQSYARSTHNIKSQLNNLDYTLQNLESSLYNVDDIVTLRDEIEEVKSQIAHLEQEKLDNQNQIGELNARLANLHYAGLEREIQKLVSQQRKMKYQKENAAVEMARFKRELKAKEAAMNEANKKKVEAMKKFSEAEKLFKERTEAAIKRCPIKITKLSGTSHEIKMMHESISTELQRNRKRIQLYNDVKRQYKIAKENADNVDMEIQLMEKLITCHQPIVKMQKEHFRIKTKDYGAAVKLCFRNLIRSRGYQGDLAISHEDKTLMCYVSLDTSSDSRAKRNLELKNGQTKVVSRKGIMEYAGGMSGGERSFTTICFLIACWQLMDMPFYILDEFDVFMDPFNRRISQYIIMNLADSKPNAQFFIFTPLQLDCQTPPNSLVMRLRRGEREDDDERDAQRRMIQS